MEHAKRFLTDAWKTFQESLQRYGKDMTARSKPTHDEIFDGEVFAEADDFSLAWTRR